MTTSRSHLVLIVKLPIRCEVQACDEPPNLVYPDLVPTVLDLGQYGMRTVLSNRSPGGRHGEDDLCLWVNCADQALT